MGDCGAQLGRGQRTIYKVRKRKGKKDEGKESKEEGR